MLTSDFSPEVEIRPFRARAMHSAIIIGAVRSLWTWTWLWGRYHVPQNAFLVLIILFVGCCTVSTRREFTLNNSHNGFLFCCKYCGKTVILWLTLKTVHGMRFAYSMTLSPQLERVVFACQFTQPVLTGF